MPFELPVVALRNLEEIAKVGRNRACCASVAPFLGSKNGPHTDRLTTHELTDRHMERR